MALSKLPSRAVRGLLQKVGYSLVRHDPRADSDIGPDDRRIIEEVEPFTRTGHERLYALIQATKYVVHANVPGAIVECGVWRGGSMMATAKTLVGLGASERDLYLFDTYEGMTEPTAADVDWSGTPAIERLKHEAREAAGSVWCFASLQDVEQAMHTTGYDSSRIHLVKGMVEETIPSRAPVRIALLRLDTDWYESTYHELTHLYPRLMTGGVIILDDYGHWKGARKAWDQYSSEQDVKILLNRIDYSARIGVKP